VRDPVFARRCAARRIPRHGSVNQKARQPIGRNDKIEGFRDICAAAGFTGSQGVIARPQPEHLMPARKLCNQCAMGSSTFSR
jgi:hypothetical protein